MRKSNQTCRKLVLFTVGRMLCITKEKKHVLSIMIDVCTFFLAACIPRGIPVYDPNNLSRVNVNIGRKGWPLLNFREGWSTPSFF